MNGIRMLRKSGLCALVAGALLWAAPAHATRPFTTVESAQPLPAGGMRVEVGMNHERWDTVTTYAITTEISYSLYTNLDLELELPWVVAGPPFVDGVGDVWGKAKINFMKERAVNPLSLSGQVGIKFPTGEALVSTEEIDVMLAALASKPFGDVTAHANLRYTFVGDSAVPMDNAVGVAVGLEWVTPIERVTVLGEAEWETARHPGREDRMALMGGATYRLTPRVRADTALRLGFSSGNPPGDGAPDYAMTIGVTVDVDARPGFEGAASAVISDR